MANKFGLPQNTQVFTTKYILLAKTPITYIEHDKDGDWYFFGSETIRNRNDYRTATLLEILDIDRSVENHADLPKNHYAYLDDESGEWKRAENQFDGDGMFVSKMVTTDGLPVLYLVREEPDNETDSGWRVFSGKEDSIYVNDPENWEFVSRSVLEGMDVSISEVLDFPPGSQFERPEKEHDWIQVS